MVSFRIAAYEAIDGMAPNSDQRIRPFCDLSHLLHVAQRHIRDEIAEDIDVDHLAHQRRLFPLRLSDRKPVGVRDDAAEGHERLLFGEPGGSRREDVPTVEGMPFSIKPILFVLDLADLDVAFLLEDMCQQSVVWSAKKVSGALRDQRAPVTADSGIHDCHMDGAVRKILVARFPRIGAIQDVMGGRNRSGG